MKYILMIALVILFAACKTKPFVKHELKFEKITDGCAAQNLQFSMISNLNGERYQFQRCLDADFQKDQLTSSQKGDTVVLKFERRNNKQALYALTIDVDSYPRYNYITIDNETFVIKPAEK